jgi:hypothetical protein
MCESDVGSPGAEPLQPGLARARCRPSLYSLPSTQVLPPFLSGTSTCLQPSLLGQGAHQILQARQGQAWGKHEWECPEQQRQQAVFLGRQGEPSHVLAVTGHPWEST